MRFYVAGLALTMTLGCAGSGSMSGRPSEFANPRVDFGIVVSDIDKAADFYAKGLGLTEVKGFDVPAEMGGDSGLTDYKPFRVRVFRIDGAEQATSVKLMQFPDTPSARVDNAFIHSSLGVSYLTLYVTDITTSVERAREAGAEPLARGPILLPKGFPEGVYLALVRDPDGNLIELVGPKKN